MQTLSFQTMTTEAHISISAEPDGELILARARAAVEEVVRLMGPHSPDSDIKRLNDSRPGQWIQVDPHTWKVLGEARLWHELSQGAFDPTIGRVKKLFAFDQRILEKWPDDREIVEAAAGVGFDKIKMRPGQLSLTVPGQRLDLGAIAKGYALDRAAEVLTDNGVRNAMVEIGGEVKVLGLHPGPPPRPWRVGIEDPRSGGKSKFTLEMSDSAVASSGGLHRHFIYNGRSYSHIIDPRTCQPLAGHGLLGITVAHPLSCMTADALGTALAVLGPVEGLECLERYSRNCGAGAYGVQVIFFSLNRENECEGLLLLIEESGRVSRKELKLN